MLGKKNPLVSGYELCRDSAYGVGMNPEDLSTEALALLKALEARAMPVPDGPALRELFEARLVMGSTGKAHITQSGKALNNRLVENAKGAA